MIRNNKKTVIFCLIIIIALIVVLVIYNNRSRFLDKEHDYKEYVSEIKKYDANEFIPVYISEEDVLKKYVNDFKNNMLYDIDEAYNTLNKEYREKRFGTKDSFQEYVNDMISSSFYSMEVDRYSKSSISGNKIFNVYIKNGYQIIIKEKSIMDYEVYLDEYTVKIE